MPIVQTIISPVTQFAASIDWFYILKTALLIAAAVCILGGVLRLIFGKNSSLVRSVSACITLVLVYLAGIILYVLVPQARDALTSLPFICVTHDAFYLYDISAMESSSLCVPLLQLFILSFLANLTDSLMPDGKKFLSWYGFRLLTVAACLGLYVGISNLIRMFVPQVYGEWAGFILLGLWAFIFLTGLLKLLMNIILAAIHPIIGAIYAFFFSNPFGKQFTKAILTTILTAILLAVLHHLGFAVFFFEEFSFASYGPVCLIAIVVLYLFGKLL